MTKKQKIRTLVILGVLLVLIIIGIILTNGQYEKHETIKEVMRDAVLHEDGKIRFFGLSANPSVVSGFIVTCIILLFALIVRLFFLPRFKEVPGKFQLLIETWVETFRNLAEGNSKHINKFLGAYVFAAGSYIFVGTCFELFGIQCETIKGHSIALPAPLADINGAISIGVLSYLVILSGGIAGNKLKGVGLTLKEFSLPISMSFRLFGALLSGALVTELVYFYINLSFGLPVVVGLLFTALHALIQAYVLCMLTTVFYGEVSEPVAKKEKKKKVKKTKEKVMEEL